jgi:hypothetical protein
VVQKSPRFHIRSRSTQVKLRRRIAKTHEVSTLQFSWESGRPLMDDGSGPRSILSTSARGSLLVYSLLNPRNMLPCACNER